MNNALYALSVVRNMILKHWTTLLVRKPIVFFRTMLLPIPTTPTSTTTASYPFPDVPVSDSVTSQSPPPVPSHSSTMYWLRILFLGITLLLILFILKYNLDGCGLGAATIEERTQREGLYASGGCDPRLDCDEAFLDLLRQLDGEEPVRSPTVDRDEVVVDSATQQLDGEEPIHSPTVDQDEVAQLDVSISEESVHSSTVDEDEAQQHSHNETLDDVETKNFISPSIDDIIESVLSDEHEAVYLSTAQQVEDESIPVVEGGGQPLDEDSTAMTSKDDAIAVAIPDAENKPIKGQRSGPSPPSVIAIPLESISSAPLDEHEAVAVSTTQRLLDEEGGALGSVFNALTSDSVFTLSIDGDQVVVGPSNQLNEADVGSDFVPVEMVDAGEPVANSIINQQLDKARLEEASASIGTISNELIKAPLEDSTIGSQLEEAENVSPAHVSTLLLNTDISSNATKNTEDEPLIPTAPSSPVSTPHRVIYSTRLPNDLPTRASSLPSTENKQPNTIMQRVTQSLTEEAFKRPVEYPIQAITFSVEHILESVSAIESAPAEAEEAKNVQEIEKSTSLDPRSLPYSPAAVTNSDDTPTASSFMPYPLASSSSFVPPPPLFFRSPSPDIYIPNYHQSASYFGPDRRPVQSLPRSRRGGKAPRLRALDRQKKLESKLLEMTAPTTYESGTDASTSQASGRQRILEASILKQTPSVTEFDTNAREMPPKSGHGGFPPLPPLKGSITAQAAASEDVSDANEHQPQLPPRKGLYKVVRAPAAGSRKVVQVVSPEERERVNLLLNCLKPPELPQAGSSSNVDVPPPGPRFSTSAETSRQVVRAASLEERERASSPARSPLIPQASAGLNVDEPAPHLSPPSELSSIPTSQAADHGMNVDEPTCPKKGPCDSICKNVHDAPSAERESDSLSNFAPLPESSSTSTSTANAGIVEPDSPNKGLYDSTHGLEREKVKSLTASDSMIQSSEVQATVTLLSKSLWADGGNYGEEARRTETARRGQRGRGRGQGRGS